MFKLTGIWEASTEESGARYTGELDITQTDDFVTAISTTGHSSWMGRIEGNILNASYIASGYGGKVVLDISNDGNRLQGTWVSNRGVKGIYAARRKR